MTRLGKLLAALTLLAVVLTARSCATSMRETAPTTVAP